MLISHTAEYALRAMAQIAAAGGEPVRASEIARDATIPVAYVSKVLRRMVAAGLLDARKGHGGGFRLARPASRIRFLDVLQAADGDVFDDRCAFGWGACSGRAPCPLHGSFAALKECTQGWAARTTLADVIDSPILRRRAR